MSISEVDEKSDRTSGVQVSMPNGLFEKPNHLPFIDCLPNELLAEIFIACTPPNAYPLDLLGVCRHWREVAYGTPSLWNTIAIRVGSRKQGTVPMADLPLWIDRAGGLPLDITVHMQPPAHSASQSKQIRQCVEVDNLLGHRFVNSLQIHDLGYNPPAHLIEVLGLLTKSRANIKDLKILDVGYGWNSEAAERWGPEHAKELEECLAHLTHLHSLTCPSITFFAVRQSYPVLQHLDITEGFTGCTLQANLSAFGDCPNLRTIRYEGTSFVEMSDAEASREFKPIVLPHLEELELIASVHIGLFLGNLQAPTLKILTLTHLSISFASLESGFTHLAADPPPLTKLAFRNFGLSEPGEPLMSLLYHLPELVEFEAFEVSNLRPEYFQVLRDSTVCPSMKLIDLTLSSRGERVVGESWTGGWSVTNKACNYKIERPETPLAPWDHEVAPPYRSRDGL